MAELVPRTSWRSLLAAGLPGWRMAGEGGFRQIQDGVIESHGGPGLLWFAAEPFEDIVLRAVWRIARPEDNSGIFLRCPALDEGYQGAIDRGYEVQIDDRAYDPERQVFGSALHRTGAIYRLAPAPHLLSRPPGQWNEFEIVARGPVISVHLNGEPASHLAHAGGRQSKGYIALQAHHQGSAVQFRSVEIAVL